MKFNILMAMSVLISSATGAFAASSPFTCNGKVLIPNEAPIICKISEDANSNLTVNCPAGDASGYNGTYALGDQTDTSSADLNDLMLELLNSPISANYQFEFDTTRIHSAVESSGARPGHETEMWVQNLFDRNGNFIGHLVQSVYGNLMGCLAPAKTQ